MAEPEITCLAEMPETQFVLSNEGIYMPGYLASVEDINIGVPDQGEPVLEGITIISMLIFLMEIIYLIVLVVRVVGAGAGRRSKIKSTNLIFHIIAGISAVLSVATVMVSSSVLQEITNMAEWEFVLVGMPVSTPQVPLLGGLVVVQVFCAVILLFSGVLLWFSKRGSIVNRMVFTLVALGVTAFSYFLVRWDLLNIAFSKLGLLS